MVLIGVRRDTMKNNRRDPMGADLITVKIDTETYEYIKECKIIPEEPFYKVLRRKLGLDKVKAGEAK